MNNPLHPNFLKKNLLLSLLALCSFCVLFTSTSIAQEKAQKPVELKIATIAPKGSSWMKIMNAWNRTVKKETGGKVKFRYYAGGVAGDEVDFIRKMRTGQLDGAAVTTTGLGLIVKETLVLSAPGLIRNYKQLDKARTAIQDELNSAFDKAGYALLSWGDGGLTRMFSASPVKTPADMKAARSWKWKGTTLFPSFVDAVGGKGVELGLPEVYPALQTGMINLVPSSALAAVALQWYTKLPYISKDPIGVVVGGIIMNKKALEKLTPEQQKIIKASGKKVEKILIKKIRKDDNKAFKTLTARKETVLVDQNPARKEWEKYAAKARNHLAGRVFPKALLKKVEKAVK